MAASQESNCRVYLSAASARERPAHAISLDLVRGDWRDHGPHTVFFRVPPFCDRSGRLRSVGFGEHLTTRVGVGRRTLRDASTGEEISVLPVQTAGGRVDAPQSVHLAESDRYIAEVTEDLALILVTDPKSAGALPQQDPDVELLDLRTGAREPLHFDNGDPARATAAWSLASGERHQTPGGALVLALFSESLPMMIVRLDLDARCLTRLRTPAYQIVGCEDENTALIISAEGHQVLRAHFDESPVEVFFPAG